MRAVKPVPSPRPQARRRAAAAAALLLGAATLGGCAAVAIPIVAGGTLAVKASEPRADTASEASAAAAASPASPGGTVEVARSATTAAGLAPLPERPPAAAPPAVAAQAPPVATAFAPPPPAPGSVGAATPLASLQLTRFDPAFARFTQDASTLARAPAPRLSALLADPVALDGVRQPCRDDHPLAVLIDLDPAGGALSLPEAAAPLPEHAAALAELRAAGLIIGWISGQQVTATGAIRRALEQSGLDRRGEDVLLLVVGDENRKQTLRENFARSACVIAIAGDERPDFDERYLYLRSPAAGARLDQLIGDVWHLVRPIFSSTSSTEAPLP